MRTGLQTGSAFRSVKLALDRAVHQSIDICQVAARSPNDLFRHAPAETLDLLEHLGLLVRREGSGEPGHKADTDWARTALDLTLKVRRQAQQGEVALNGALTDPRLLGYRLDRAVQFLERSEGSRLVERVHVGALNVLNQGNGNGLLVAYFTDDSRHCLIAERLHGEDATLTRDDLEAASRDRPKHRGIQEAPLLDASGQLGKSGILGARFEVLPGIELRDHDGIHRDFGHLHGSFVHSPKRYAEGVTFSRGDKPLKERKVTNEMTGISKGSPAAWKTRGLIETWAAGDDEALQATLGNVGSDLQDVVRNLIIVAGGTVQAIATAAHQPFEDVLAFIWRQLAQRESDDDTARLVRAAVTAWSEGDETAEFLNKSRAFDGVDPEALILHLLGLTVLLGQQLCERLGQPFAEALTGIWIALGTDGALPSEQ
jgi:hypothetical protein